MPSRSGMAAFTLAAGVVGLLQSPAWPADDSKVAAVVNHVKLELQIEGLSRQGCEVEIAPGHRGCQFVKIVKRIECPNASDLPETKVVIVLDRPIEAQSTNADRDCAFAITIREPGHKPRTFHRGLRLATRAPDGSIPVQSLTCYLSTPSLAARDEARRPRR
jgi:hypothetical protein